MDATKLIQDLQSLLDLSPRRAEMAARAVGDDADMMGDPIVAATYFETVSLGALVRGDRKAWALGIAKAEAASIRSARPDLAAAFPVAA